MVFAISTLVACEVALLSQKVIKLTQTIQPDLSNPTWYVGRRWFFSKNSWKILFNGQNDWSGRGPPSSSDFWKAPLNENYHFGGQQCSVATLLALIASLIARVETNFAILTTIIRHLKRRLKMPCLGPVHLYLVKTVTENAAFQKRSSEWRFLQTPASHFRVDGPKRRFSNTMMSNIIYTTSILHVS